MRLYRRILNVTGLESEVCEFTDGSCAVADYVKGGIDVLPKVPWGYDELDTHTTPWPRLFHLLREEDETGKTGTGVVAEGVVFTGGSCVLRWLSDTPSTVVYPGARGLEHMETVHGHNGRTRVIWRTSSESDGA